MIDFIELTKVLRNGEILNLGHLHLEAEYASGLQKYFIKGCRSMVLDYNPQLRYIKIKGSPLYFSQGHNFTWNKQTFTESIQYIEKLIGISLFDSIVERFEYGKIMRVEQKPQRIISGHLAGSGLTMEERTKDKGNIRYFNDKFVALKLYNAGINIQHKQGIEMKDIIQKAGWNPKDNFLKFEVHYKKPHLSLNNGRGLTLSDILLPSFEKTMKADLYNQYKRLEKMKSIEMPSTKKELFTSDIILLALAEVSLNQGKDPKKLIYSFIKAIPEEVLSTEDKKARKKQVKALLEKIHASEVSGFDVSEKFTDII